MTDGDGRLVVLPGRRARLLAREPTRSRRSPGNNGWTDDVCDGPCARPSASAAATIEADPALGARHAAELRAGDGDGPRHALRRRALGARRRRAARRRPGELRERHPADLRPPRRHAVGQRGLLPRERLRKRASDWLSDANARAARGSVPASGGLPARAVRARSAIPPTSPRNPAPIPDMYGDGVEHPAEDARQWLTVTPLPVPAARRLGGGRFTRTTATARRAFRRSFARAAGRGAARGARPGGARVVPGRRVPPRHRGAVDAARRVHVGPARCGCACARPRSTTASGAPELTQEAVLSPDGPLQGVGARRSDPLARRAVAQRRGQLPLRLPAQHLDGPAHVLARPHPQPGAARGRLPDRHGPVAAAGRAPGGVRSAPRLGALHRPAGAPEDPRS